MKKTIAAVMNLHGEGLVAHPSIGSYALCCQMAQEAGYTVQRIAVLDTPDALTQSVVAHRKDAFDQIEVVAYGDLGLSRNHGVNVALADYVAFFDADDLWGEAWLRACAHFMQGQPDASNIVCHPEYMYWFTAADFVRQSPAEVSYGSHSNFMKFVDSEAPGFDRAAIIFANLYTSNSFAPRSLYLSHPFRAADKAGGIGVEDWAWNAHTLSIGMRHAVVPGTVHLVRHRDDSLSSENIKRGLLPPMHELAPALLE
jgi:hypothetical protein